LKSHKTLKDQHCSLIRDILLEYIQWPATKPFDIGNTCRKGIAKLKQQEKALREGDEAEWPLLLKKVFQDVQEINKDSESNGSLMRITPMAVLLACTGESPAQH
jgi:ADP-ribosylglycohydrolase